MDAPCRHTANAARSAFRVLMAAQCYAATVDASAIDQGSENGRILLGLLDAVNEYEGHAAGMTPSPERGGPGTLW